MTTQNFLYKDRIRLTEESPIEIVIPDVGTVVDNEDEYYSMVTCLTSMPVDLMVQLKEAGYDFTEITEYELFLMLFSGLREMNTKLVFGDLDLSEFEYMTVNSSNQIILYDAKHDITIDRPMQQRIAWALRKIHHLKRNRRKPANEEAKRYMMERAIKKARRNKNRKQESQLEALIVALVNTEQFKYDFESVRNLSIYQFNESVQQIIKKVSYDNTMHGVYAGTINAKKLSQDELNWLTHK